jgi:3',5'-cyclic-nucleotide phosphodiesterase
MTVKAFPLSHVNPFESTFLIKNNDAYVLYLEILEQIILKST